MPEMARVLKLPSRFADQVQGGGKDEEQSIFIDAPSKKLRLVSPFEEVARGKIVTIMNVGENIFILLLVNINLMYQLRSC